MRSETYLQQFHFYQSSRSHTRVGINARKNHVNAIKNFTYKNPQWFAPLQPRFRDEIFKQILHNICKASLRDLQLDNNVQVFSTTMISSRVFSSWKIRKS